MTATLQSKSWQFPSDVKGWLSRAEGEALRDLAKGKTVLEIGSYHGRSTICMAQVARLVTSIDWHKGDEACGWEGSEAAFRENLERYDATDKVDVRVGESSVVSEELAAEGLTHHDFAFIDGAHDEESVRADIASALKLVKPDGIIAMHDIDYPDIIGPARELLGEMTGKADRMGWWDLGDKKPAKVSTDHVFVAYPFRPGEVTRRKELSGNGKIAVQAACRERTQTVAVSESSDYCRNFNGMWIQAHNDKTKAFSHWAMQHDDIVAEAGWCDKLIDEMDRVGADVMSTIIPLKDHRGLTTTGIRDPKRGGIRRFSMREIHEQLPPTFSIEEVKAAGFQLGRDDTLLVNTGLWVVRFDKHKAVLRRYPGFCTTHTIGQNADGNLVCAELTEDWDFSEWARRAGLKVFATRIVTAIHEGDWATDDKGQKLIDADTGRPYRVQYRNDEVWGAHDTDLGDDKAKA